MSVRILVQESFAIKIKGLSDEVVPSDEGTEEQGDKLIQKFVLF